jgi:hypothetical protein
MKQKPRRPKRIMVKIDAAHHAILRRRRDELGVSIEAQLDEALGLGMRYKRWIVEEPKVQAA